MTLENIYYIGQTIAVVAILGSLAGIYFQQRQANKIARSDMSQRVSSSFSDSMRELMSNPGLALAFRKVMFERSELDPVESTQILTYFNLTLTAHADAYLAYNEGLIGRPLLTTFDGNTAWYLTAPAFEREWRRVRRFALYPPNFCDHVDAQFAKLFPDNAAAPQAVEAPSS